MIAAPCPPYQGGIKGGCVQALPNAYQADGVARDGRPVPYGYYRPSFCIVGVGFPDPCTGEALVRCTLEAPLCKGSCQRS